MDIQRGGKVNKNFNSPDFCQINGIELNVQDQNAYAFFGNTEKRRLIVAPNGVNHQSFSVGYVKSKQPNLKGSELIMVSKEFLDSFDITGRIWLNVEKYDGIISTWEKKTNIELFNGLCNKLKINPNNVLYTYGTEQVLLNDINTLNAISDEELNQDKETKILHNLPPKEKWKETETFRTSRDEQNAQYNKEHGYSCDAERHFKERMDENSENEFTAYHGSAASFKNFDLSFIGTGEGAQYYGYGVYVSDCKHTGELYADVAYKNKTSEVSINGYTAKNVDEKVIMDEIYAYQMKVQENGQNPHMKDVVLNAVYDDMIKLESEKSWYERMGDDFLKDYNKTLKHYLKIIYFINHLPQNYLTIPKYISPKKYLYQVDIPEDNGENYISWLGSNKVIEGVKYQIYDELLNKFGNKFDTELNSFMKYCKTFEDVYKIIMNENWMTPQELSEFLSYCGYVGIKVPTGALHGGDGYGINYVIFNPNDIEILQKDVLQETENDDEYTIGGEGDTFEYKHVMNEVQYYNHTLPDYSDVGIFEYEIYVDEDDYNEYLIDNELQDSDDIRKQYFNNEVQIELTFYDHEYNHYIASESMFIDDIRELYGEKLAEIIFNNCYNKFEFKGKVDKSSLIDEIDLNDSDAVNNFCLQYMPTGEYFKGCRGFILTNGTVVYTEQEHNDILLIPNLKSKFDFIRMGNIRIMPNSMDIGQCPTYAQIRVLRQLINDYADDELYLDIFNNGHETGCKYDYPDDDEVIADIYRFYQDGIKPTGGHGNMRNDLYENTKK